MYIYKEGYLSSNTNSCRNGQAILRAVFCVLYQFYYEPLMNYMYFTCFKVNK